jgi:hypothetical protein
MKIPTDFQRAHVSSDGCALKIGMDAIEHPIYGTTSYYLLAALTLSPEEKCLYECAESGDGLFRLHIRSALAQLGVDAFHPSCAKIVMTENVLRIETLITSFNGEGGMHVISRIRTLIDQGVFPRIMHAGFFPKAAKLQTAAQVNELITSQSLYIGDADTYADGSVGLIPADPLYTFRREAITSESIDTILMGHGRATLVKLRGKSAALPEQLLPGAFIVTGVNVETKDHHVVLRREVLTDGVHAKVVHGESCILQAGRTRGGSRQLELWNTNGTPQPLKKLRVVADIYKAAAVAEPGH